MEKTACRICGNGEGNTVFTAREMMYGTRELFEYLECRECGCLQLVSVPADPAVYYGSGYCSFQRGGSFPRSDRGSALGRWCRRARSMYLLGGGNAAGFLFSKVRPCGDRLAEYLGLLRKCGARPDWNILDVGCGSGQLLLELWWNGFDRLSGIDTGLDQDIRYENGVTVLRREISRLEERYELIMFHHSFEHMADPQAALCAASHLLSSDGVILIRMPYASSFAWKHYGPDWVQLDPPRHVFVHTLKSLGIVAERAGLAVGWSECDSTEFQFWGSEQYRRDIPLNDPRSYSRDPTGGIFSEGRMKEFREKALQLNAEGTGDQVRVCLTKQSSGKGLR